MEIIPYIFIFLLGAVIASFATVVAERLHTGERWVSGRSRCNSCGRELSSRDLVPILSWVFSRGRCTACGGRVPGTYALTEGVTGLSFALALYKIGAAFELVFFLIALSILVFIVVYDIRHTLIPQIASLLFVASSLIFSFFYASSLHAFGSALLFASCIALFFFLMHVFSRGKAMGLGDTPLSFALSLLVAPYAVSGLLFSFWIGALWGIGVLVFRRGGPKMGIEVPFAPFLALGYLLAYLIEWNPFAF